MNSNPSIDLERGLPVTSEDVSALRRARETVPSWFSLSWREVLQMLPPAARHSRPVATDAWQPFTLA